MAIDPHRSRMNRPGLRRGDSRERVRALVAWVFLIPALFLAASPAAATQKRALFDNTHQETAGNADWQIDTDQPLPLPDQSTVTASTPRTYWLGAISSWAIDLVKRGYFVATLTTAYGITYGNAGNPHDLSNYDVFIVDEPNTRFTSAESTAIFNYVRDGGGLIAVADHNASDRNGDGVDSPRAWDWLDAAHFWGVHFDTAGEANNNITQNSGNIDMAPDDSIIQGPNGVADSVSYHNGTTMILYPGTNPTVRGNIWMTGAAHGTTQVMVAQSMYGSGRLVFVGDSSPADDGSATPGNSSIYDGWGEATGRDSLLFQNATMWATRRSAPADTTPPTVAVVSPNGGEVWQEGSVHTIAWTAADNVGIDSINVDCSMNGAGGPWSPIQHGIANSGSIGWTVPNAASDSVLVRVIAFDAALNQAADQSDVLFRIVSPLTGVPEGEPAAFASLRLWPNPSRESVRLSLSLPVAGSARLEVLDPAGRAVWATDLAGRAAGEQTVVWNGRGLNGRSVSPGIYFVRVSHSRGTSAARLIRLP